MASHNGYQSLHKGAVINNREGGGGGYKMVGGLSKVLPLPGMVGGGGVGGTNSFGIVLTQALEVLAILFPYCNPPPLPVINDRSLSRAVIWYTITQTCPRSQATPTLGFVIRVWAIKRLFRAWVIMRAAHRHQKIQEVLNKQFMGGGSQYRPVKDRVDSHVVTPRTFHDQQPISVHLLPFRM